MQMSKTDANDAFRWNRCGGFTVSVGVAEHDAREERQDRSVAQHYECPLNLENHASEFFSKLLTRWIRSSSIGYRLHRSSKPKRIP